MARHPDPAAGAGGQVMAPGAAGSWAWPPASMAAVSGRRRCVLRVAVSHMRGSGAVLRGSHGGGSKRCPAGAKMIHFHYHV
eukprot:SAG31_NODE_5558_length_2458_cov_9.398123_1_plen_81_part_00